MLHVNMKTNSYQQSTIHVVCCIMFVYVKTAELLEKIEYKNRLVVVHISYENRLANNKIAREEKK